MHSPPRQLLRDAVALVLARLRVEIVLPLVLLEAWLPSLIVTLPKLCWLGGDSEVERVMPGWMDELYFHSRGMRTVDLGFEEAREDQTCYPNHDLAMTIQAGIHGSYTSFLRDLPAAIRALSP